MAEDTRDNQEKIVASYEAQVKEINELVKIRVAPSDTHGVGVFALRDIPKGSKLYADIAPLVYNLPYNWFGKLREEVRELLVERFPLVVSGSGFAIPDTRFLAYMNHSDIPNYDAVKDETLLDIQEGEEIFEDYKKIDTWRQVYPWLKV
jgi:hypothetical protein